MITRLMRPFYFLYYLFLYRNKWVRRPKRKAAKAFFSEAIATCPAGAMAIDCGANVGAISQALLDRGIHVHAFEPDPVASKMLLERIGDHPQLEFHPAAVGTSNTRMELYRTDDFDDDPTGKTVSSSLHHRKTNTRGNFIVVDVIDLIEFLEARKGSVHLIKMDIEGAEVELLERMLETGIHESIPYILVETHERISRDIALRTAKLRTTIRCQRLTNFNLDHA